MIAKIVPIPIEKIANAKMNLYLRLMRITIHPLPNEKHDTINFSITT